MEFRYRRSWSSRSSFLLIFTATWNENFSSSYACDPSLSCNFVRTYHINCIKQDYKKISFIFRFWIILPKPSESDIAAALEIQKQVNKDELKNPKGAIIKKVKLIPGLMKYMIPFGLVYLFEYFINQGTVRYLID